MRIGQLADRCCNSYRPVTDPVTGNCQFFDGHVSGKVNEMDERLTVYELLLRLQPAHPDLTVSKVRFLEHEGVFQALRGTDGKLRYSVDDVLAALGK